MTPTWISGLRRRWNGVGRRRTEPMPAAQGRPAGGWIRTLQVVQSPGDWVVPPGRRPGWDWLPEPGAVANLRSMPWWVRCWYRTPLVDRYAYEWMWWHGGWSVRVASGEPPRPPDAGVREPRRPAPAPGSLTA